MKPVRLVPPAMKAGYVHPVNRLRNSIESGDAFRYLKRKADFFEGFANSLPELQRKWLLNQVVDMRRLLNELEKKED